MRLKRAVLSLTGYILLALAALSTVAGLAFAALWLLGMVPEPAGTVVFAEMLYFGFAFLCGLFGAYLRKAVAGTVLPLDVDTDRWRTVVFKGGQG